MWATKEEIKELQGAVEHLRSDVQMLVDFEQDRLAEKYNFSEDEIEEMHTIRFNGVVVEDIISTLPWNRKGGVPDKGSGP